MNKIAILDYGMGNLHSVAKAVERVAGGAKVQVTNDPQQIATADRVLFPGVGAIRDCMHGLKTLGLDTVILDAINNKPVLAICVGMQALMEFSEENDGVDCLGVFPGKVRFFGENLHDPVSNERLKVPHMGWNQVHQTIDHPLWKDIDQNSRFYFVHSYYVETSDSSLLAGETDYGKVFSAALSRDNVFAVQFHPEKSQHSGLQLLANFCNWQV